MGRKSVVLLVPGADALAFTEDMLEAAARGLRTLPLTVPRFEGHPIDDRRAYFDQMATMIAQAAAGIRKSEPDFLVSAIGRNNGGGLLGYAVACGAPLDRIVLTGAVPSISRFYSESRHERAQRLRAQLASSNERESIVEARATDLVTSAMRMPAERCLFQFGRNDPWIDETASDAIELLSKRFQVVWTPDDHAMASAVSLGQRWDFLADQGSRATNR